MRIKKDLKSYSVNSLYSIFDKVKGYFEKINENKHLMLVPTNESKTLKSKKIWRTMESKISKNSDD